MEIRSALKNSACYYVKMQCIFSLRELDTETDSKRTEACAVPILTLALCQACSSRGKERKGGCWERVRMCVCLCVCARVSECVRERERGQTFPWQDPRVPTEGRVQPLKERLRARQSISGLHLHNKWSSYSFSSPSHTSTHTPLMSVSTQRSSAHANARS